MSAKGAVRHHSPAKKTLPFIVAGCATLIFVVWSGALIVTARHALPRIENTFYSVDDSVPEPFEFPLSFESKGSNLRIDFDLVSPWGYRPILWVGADDCIQGIYINGNEMWPPEVPRPYCLADPKQFRFGNELQGPTNHFNIHLDDGGGLTLLRVNFSKTDPLLLLFWVLGIAGFVGWLLVCRRLLRWHPTDVAVATLFVVGVFIRVMYVGVTPPDTRSHEWDKHLDYIRYVSEHFRVPPAAEGWEYHQPPLYYFITGGWFDYAQSMNRSIAAVLHDLQMFSLFLSVLTFFLGICIAYTIYRKPAERSARLLFVALITTFPTLVMFSSRISNDVLAQTLSFLFLFFLLHWWEEKRMTDYIMQALVIAVSLITKVSALLFLAISMSTLLVANGVRFSKKIQLGVITVVLCALVAGWLPVLRYTMEQDKTRSMVLGNEGMNDLVVTNNDPVRLFTFNPLGVLRHPYNDPDNDETRRQYFPEYFFKSAFFGEFFRFTKDFRMVTFLILLLGMITLPLILFGLVSSIRFRHLFTEPMALVFAFALSGTITYRLLFAYIPNQDFRFVTFMIIPLAYFALQGASVLPAPVRRFFHAILWSLACCCGIFFLKLILA